MAEENPPAPVPGAVEKRIYRRSSPSPRTESFRQVVPSPNDSRAEAIVILVGRSGAVRRRRVPVALSEQLRIHG